MISLGKHGGKWYIRWHTPLEPIRDRSITVGANKKTFTVHWKPYHLYTNLYIERARREGGRGWLT